MIAIVQLKCILAKSNLFLLVEGEMMPSHLHGQVSTSVATEEFIKLRSSMIKLFIWRLDVHCIFAETVRGFAGVPFIPDIRNGLHEMFGIFGGKVHINLQSKLLMLLVFVGTTTALHEWSKDSFEDRAAIKATQ